MSAAPLDASPPQRSGASGSEKRQRAKVVSVRLMPDHFDAWQAKAEAAGLSLGAFIRACVDGTPGPRAKRSPPVNAELLARATAELNKAGSNLNQIGRSLNFGRSIYETFNIETLAEVRQAVSEIRSAVGRQGRP